MTLLGTWYGQPVFWLLLAFIWLSAHFPTYLRSSYQVSITVLLILLQGDIGRIRPVYDAFLAEYPLCYGYWKKYADAEAKYVSLQEASLVYDRGVAAVPYSVDLWGHYALHKQKAAAPVEEVERYKPHITFTVTITATSSCYAHIIILPCGISRRKCMHRPCMALD